jgi:hypothetical protein
MPLDQSTFYTENSDSTSSTDQRKSESSSLAEWVFRFLKAVMISILIYPAIIIIIPSIPILAFNYSKHDPSDNLIQLLLKSTSPLVLIMLLLLGFLLLLLLWQPYLSMILSYYVFPWLNLTIVIFLLYFT